MKITYLRKNFSFEHRRVIEQAAEICDEYAGRGLNLTLRQLYYQFVARGLLANQQKEYDRLGRIINDARMAGALDWEFLVDRTRNLVAPSTWDSPAALIHAAAAQYQADLWAGQNHRVEVWIEKDAGIGVIEAVCRADQVPYFSCRGYTSASELWNAAQRIGDHLVNGNRVTVLHIGDHDPSGLDMTRDIKERLATFLANDWYRSGQPLHGEGSTNDRIRASMRSAIREHGGTIGDDDQPWRVRRIALSYAQVLQYDPPPNPAKTTDSRFLRYQEETGLDESWELDALDPGVLQALIRREIDAARDEDLWNDALAAQETERHALQRFAQNWSSR